MQAVQKSGTNTSLLVATFLDTVNSYGNIKEVIYTDGSKKDDGVGCAFTSMESEQRFTLNPITSIYRAELFAIIQALLYIRNKEPGTYLICSDSLSVIQSITRNMTLDAMIQELLKINQSLASEMKSGTFVWSPGHLCIP